MFDVLQTKGRTCKKSNVIEFHVDAISDDVFDVLHPLINDLECSNDGIGLNQSIFREDKPKKVLLVFGQDECIFKQFLLNNKAWQTKDGRFTCRPKDDGSGLMVSAFQGRSHGFGFPDFEKLKHAVNKYRKGKHYFDVKAAKRILSKTEKGDLEDDPFIRLFQYGNSDGKEGYWSYDHMVIQLEDVIDVLFVAFGKKYVFLFLFDHSCGHDRMHPDALNVNAMNVGFGGRIGHEMMHDSKILEVHGFLGKFLNTDDPCQLKKGDIQRFYFTEDDVGPFWMSEKKIGGRIRYWVRKIVQKRKMN